MGMQIWDLQIGLGKGGVFLSSKKKNVRGGARAGCFGEKSLANWIGAGKKKVEAGRPEWANGAGEDREPTCSELTEGGKRLVLTS